MNFFTRKRALQTVLIVFVCAFITVGIVEEDVREVISNATLLCYSCIGLK